MITNASRLACWRPIAYATAADALLPDLASAHLVTTGLGPIYDGISHLLLSPEDLVPVLALAMLAGINGPAGGRRSLFALSTAWLVGGFLGVRMGMPLLPAWVLSGSFLAIGLLTAWGRSLPPHALTWIAVSVGLLHGALNGVGIAEARRETLGLAGIVGTVFVTAAIVSAFVVGLNSGWARLAVRVAGSWVAATGLLMLGWSFRGIV